MSDTRVELGVEGMSCSACAARIETALAELDGVADARVNFATSTATVQGQVTLDEKTLATAIVDLGYGVVRPEATDQAEADRQADLFRRLVVAAGAAAVIMVLSMVEAAQFSGWEWVVAVLSVPVVWWSGWVFHRSAAANLRHRATTMDTLVSMGSLSAWFWSMTVLVADIDGGHLYFETAAMIVALILLGKWFEVRAKRRSGDAIRALADLGVNSAELEDGTIIPLDDLAVGMRFVARPGAKIATDGVVIEGRSAVDASMITGESVPVEAGPGDTVIGATINLDGALVVEATKVGADTALSQIVSLVNAAQGGRAAVQRLADRVSAVFVPLAIAVAVVTLVAWLAITGDVDAAFTAAVAVLIIACPCALGLATPLAITVGTGRGAQLGVIIKGGEILEDTRTVDTVLLDKTGTVTTGLMSFVDIHAPTGDGHELLALAAAVESRSEHPIGRAITDAVPEAPVRQSTDFELLAGRGVRGTVEGTEVRVGRRTLFDVVDPVVEEAAVMAEATGATAVLVGRGSAAEAVIVVADEVKPTSVEAVEALHDQGLSVTLLTGDNQRTAREVGMTIGADSVIAEVLPADKLAEVERLQQLGHRVAMVGDGINDGPALAGADLGIAIGTGTDVAREASDLTIVSGDLRAVADAIALSRRTLATIKGNLFWAFAYNAAAIPLAAFGILRPMYAAAAMGLSSVFVVTNSLRLRRFAPLRGKSAESGATLEDDDAQRRQLSPTG